jgi:hypothetical protein
MSLAQRLLRGIQSMVMAMVGATAAVGAAAQSNGAHSPAERSAVRDAAEGWVKLLDDRKFSTAYSQLFRIDQTVLGRKPQTESGENITARQLESERAKVPAGTQRQFAEAANVNLKDKTPYWIVRFRHVPADGSRVLSELVTIAKSGSDQWSVIEYAVK